MKTVLVPLSDYESNPKDNTAVTLGYQFPILSTEEGDDLEKAIRSGMANVVQKWTLLAGRLRWCPELGRAGRWAIIVPLGELAPTYLTHTISTTAHSNPIPLSSSLDPLLPTSATLLHRPPPSYFRNFKVAAANCTCLEENSPLLSVKITRFTDCLCLGISVPHGVVDGTGMGQIISALNSELNGLPWTPPLLQTGSNILSDALNALPQLSPEAASNLPQVMRDYSPFSIWSALKFITRFWAEKYWFRVTMRGIYIGRSAVDSIMKDIKKELADREEKEWVSEGDVLVAWALKAAYATQPKRTQTLHVSPVFSIRSLLATSLPLSASPPPSALLTYSHNANISFPLPILPISSLSSVPLSSLALIHRRCLDEARRVEYVKKSLDWVAAKGGAWVPDRNWGKDSWIVTNQSSGGLTSLSWKGMEISRFWIWFFPITPSHGLSINKFLGGYLLMSALRPEQWASIEQELERIKDGKEHAIV